MKDGHNGGDGSLKVLKVMEGGKKWVRNFAQN